MNYFLTEALLSPQSYVDQLEVLHQKHIISGTEFHIEQEGVSLGEMVLKAKDFSKALCSELKNGSYQFSPAQLRMIQVKDKERLIFRFSLTDSIIHGVVARTLMDYCQTKFSPHLYSYLKGKNWWDGISDFSKFSRKYFNSVKEVKKRGLFILRRDISKYTDSIPVGETSPLWPLLKQVLDFPTKPSKLDLIAFSMVKNVIRTEANSLEGDALFTTFVGVPTGSPISTTLFNIYMMKLDEELDQMKPDFYVRYGDDLIFADQDPEKTKTAAESILRILKEHWLSNNEKKSQTFYLNKAGRGYEHAPFKKGSNAVEFLGAMISAEGMVYLPKKKVNALMIDLNQRISRVTKNLDKKTDIDEKGRIISSVINEALDPNSHLSQKSAALLRFAVTDRDSLKQIDLEINQLVLKWVLGSTSIKGFRKVPPSKMRSWGLQSIYHLRNMHGK